MTPKQAMFAREYVVDLNATQAAIRAGYSPDTAEQQGSRLLRNVQVKAAVDVLTKERAERLELTADKVLKDIDRLAEKAEVFGEFGAAIKGRELLGKHLKLFTEKHEHSGEGLTVVVQSLAEPKKGAKK